MAGLKEIVRGGVIDLTGSELLTRVGDGLGLFRGAGGNRGNSRFLRIAML